MSGVMMPWVVAIALVSYRAVAGKESLKPPLAAPLPSTYVSTAIAFGILGVIDHSGRAGSVPTLIGWGFDAAIALNLFSRPKVVQGTAPGEQPLVTAQQQTAFATTAGLGAPAAG